MKNFRIKYEAYNASGHIIKYGEMRAKNKPNEFVAKIGLENHFQKSLVGFSRLVVVSCREETIMDDIFKNWPFPKFGDSKS